MQWHFHESTGCPFWLRRSAELKFDPLKEVKGFEDSKKFPPFEDEWLRGGPVRRWVPRACQERPIYVFETGGTTGIPKSRVVIDDFRIDYELFSETLPDKYFPQGRQLADARARPGPRRLRLAVEHCASIRGGICFCIDLDPRWVIKLIKKGWMEHLEAYKEHCIDQAITILTAGHDIKCMFATPKLLDALALALEERGTSIREAGHHRHLLRRHRVHAAVDPLLRRRAAGRAAEASGVYMTPTYGNTLMGLACSRPVTAEDGYKITLLCPAAAGRRSKSSPSTTRPQTVGYGETGRVKLTTLTKEFFVPGFLERDEGEREPPYTEYPWDGVSGVRPYRGVAAETTVGVY